MLLERYGIVIGLLLKSGSTLAQDKRIVNLNYDHVLHFRSQLTGSYDAVTQGEEGSKKEVEVGHIFVAHP